MARPLSEEKRNSLLAAATDEVASAGIAASTTKIAKSAGVAEGTLFVYFSTKDGLFNQLFLTLKSDLVDYLTAEYPADAGIQEQIQYIWSRFIDWGAGNPAKHKALRQLSVSDRITEVSHNTGEALFYDLQKVIERGFKAGILRKQPVSFLGGVIQALADMVLEMAYRDPSQLDQFKTFGWASLWGAIVQK